MSRPAPAGRPRFSVGDIVRRHRAELEQRVRLSATQRQALTAIARCRTAALGGHLDVCRNCGRQHPAYNSCRNRHCCLCQALTQERWIAARSERLLPVQHFHVVFTLPAELRALAKCYPRLLFEALFRAASETLLELGHSRFKALLGITLVLHTWTRTLQLHPHLHAIVTAGGLSGDGQRWAASSRKYLFPVEVMGQLLRGKVLASLRRLHVQGRFHTFHAFRDPQAFDQLLARLAGKSWLVYAKRPFRETRHVVEYLGRYTHRVAISNSRLVDVTDQLVTFRTKNGQLEVIPPVEFLRRFVQHVLPPGFHKIRHYGLYAGTHVGSALATARAILSGSQPPVQAPASTAPSTSAACWMDQLRQLTGRDVRRCPHCGGPLQRLPLPRPSNRDPPASYAA